MTMKAIEVRGLTKTYPGGIRAVDQVSFWVGEGEIFGFLGPNGAGKSTTILMLTTLATPTAGSATVMGYDVTTNTDAVRRSLGYVSQDLAVDDSLTGWENLYLQARFYGLTRDEMRRRIPEVLDMVGLTSRARDLVETYSGGMRKRLDIAAGLIHRPKVLFLDEPTLGLDIQTRREIWDYITRLREESGMTIFLTTHYMEEADRLCDRIAIIDRGSIKAVGTPSELKSTLGGDVIVLRFGGTDAGVAEALARIRALPGVRDVARYGDDYRVAVQDGESTLPQFFAATQDGAAPIVRVSINRVTLDDVYLSFTGRALRDEESSREDALQQRIRMRRVRG